MSESAVQSENMTVGVVGLGIMGSAFARNILDAGFTVVGHDILQDNVKSLVEMGGTAASSARDTAIRSDVVITSLPDVPSFHEVMTGSNGICSATKDGLIVIECSTLSIQDKQDAHDALQTVNSILLDCPISGTGAQAITRDLSIYVSGNKSAGSKCQPVFDAMASHTFFVGGFGNGSKMKFVANTLVSIHNVASAEAMTLGIKAGLDPENIFNVIKAGAGNSRIFELRAPMMVDNNYSDATMKMDVWQKDLEVIGEFANELECPLPLFTESSKIYNRGMDMGFAKLDTASVCQVLEQMAGINRK